MPIKEGGEYSLRPIKEMYDEDVIKFCIKVAKVNYWHQLPNIEIFKIALNTHIFHDFIDNTINYDQNWTKFWDKLKELNYDPNKWQIELSADNRFGYTRILVDYVGERLFSYEILKKATALKLFFCIEHEEQLLKLVKLINLKLLEEEKENGGITIQQNIN